MMSCSEGGEGRPNSDFVWQGGLAGRQQVCFSTKSGKYGTFFLYALEVLWN